MITIVSKNFIDVYDLDMGTFLTVFNTQGINAPDIRVKNALHVDMQYKHLLNGILPTIEVCFFENDGDLSLKPVEELRKLIADVSQVENSAVAPLPEAEPVVVDQPVVGQVVPVESLTPVAGVVAETLTETATDGVPAELDEEDNKDSAAVQPVEGSTAAVVQPVEEPAVETEEEPFVLDGAVRTVVAAFDKLLSRYPHISTRIKREGMDAVAEFVQSELPDQKIGLLGSILPRDIIMPMLAVNQANELVVNSNFGETTDLLDSVIASPVYSIIVGKDDFEEKFSFTKLVNSYYIRFSPFGLQEYEDYEVLQGFVQKIKITNMDVSIVRKEMEDKLKSEKTSMRSLSAATRLAMFEQLLAKHYNSKQGELIRAKGVEFSDSLNDFFQDLSDAGYCVDHLTNEEELFICRAYDCMIFDNREIMGDRPVTLLSQLEKGVYPSLETPKPIESVILPRPEIAPVINPDHVPAVEDSQVEPDPLADTISTVEADAVNNPNPGFVVFDNNGTVIAEGPVVAQPEVEIDYLGEAIDAYRQNEQSTPGSKIEEGSVFAVNPDVVRNVTMGSPDNSIPISMVTHDEYGGYVKEDGQYVSASGVLFPRKDFFLNNLAAGAINERGEAIVSQGAFVADEYSGYIIPDGQYAGQYVTSSGQVFPSRAQFVQLLSLGVLNSDGTYADGKVIPRNDGSSVNRR